MFIDLQLGRAQVNLNDLPEQMACVLDEMQEEFDAVMHNGGNGADDSFMG